MVGGELMHAISVWLLPGGRVVVERFRQDEYDAFALGRGGVGDAPGRPSEAAVFLMAAGGLVAREPEWSYGFERALPPVDGYSDVVGIEVFPARARFSSRRIANHRSVTFDAASSGTVISASSITVSHTTTTSADRYIAGLSQIRQGQTLSGVTYAAVTLPARLDQASGNNRSTLSDLVAPATGANNLVFTFSGATDGPAGGISAYGVDQTTPVSNTAVAIGSDAVPTATCTSAVGELAISGVSWHPSGGVNTVDASWTTDWNVVAARNGAAAHKAGAASVTRTDAMALSEQWAIVIASVKEVAAAGGQPTMRRWGGTPSMGKGRSIGRSWG